MSTFWLPIFIAAVVVAVVWRLRLRAARRRQICRQRLASLLEHRRPELKLIESEPDRWRLCRDGLELAPVDGRRLTRALPAERDRRRRLLLAVADAAAGGPRPFAGEFDLKSHGARVLPRLADDGLPLLALEPAVRFVAPDSAGLATIYIIDGEPRPVYLTDGHLDGSGIDARDVHGVALAVLRQRLEETRLRAALDSARVETLEPVDGCGGSRLLLLPELLRRDETLFAAAPSPGRLLVAADRATLVGTLAAMDEPTQPLAPAIFRVTGSGLTLES